MFPTEMHVNVCQKMQTRMFIVDLCYETAKNWKQPKCQQQTEQINKLRYTHTRIITQ